MRYIPFLLFISLLLGSCTNELVERPSKDPIDNLEQSDKILKGVVLIKLSREVGNEIAEIVQQSNTLPTNSGIYELDDYFESIGAYKAERVYPYAGKYEKRTRKSGLHLWYRVYFDAENNQISTKKAVQSSGHASCIQHAEPVYRLVRPADQTTFTPVDISNTKASGNKSKFNDPLFSNQWNFYNDGSIHSAIAGADVNILPAWEETTGRKEVIVSVVDEGIDYMHEDLAGSMLINLAELNGAEGVDDDNNGYIDDIYGYNFCRPDGKLAPADHGTHVAGVIAARNNNGIGVCGIAGGDGSPESGVRIISSQVFDFDPVYGIISTSYEVAGEAIKYGADRGAVISQNSWGYPTYLWETPQVLKDAIDYFIENAGCDEEGNQRADSPMKGGIVVFASGNLRASQIQDKTYIGVPAQYEPVISVGSFGPDFVVAHYTSIGPWLDIMAPGGTGAVGPKYLDRKGFILSTVAGNKYAAAPEFAGTSMACPHVSGIAALVVSKFGGQGFTNEELKRRLMTGLLPIDIYEVHPPQYKGLLGVGYIDAKACLAENKGIAPGTINSLELHPSFSSIRVNWKAVSDEDDGTVFKYRLYYSTTELTTENYELGTEATIHGFVAKVGEDLSFTADNLSQNVEYYFAIMAEDRWGNKSAVTLANAKTNNNNPPSLKAENDNTPIIVYTNPVERIVYVEDAENHTWTYEINGNMTGVAAEKVAEGIKLTFYPNAGIGTHKLTIAVTDQLAAQSQIAITYTVKGVNKELPQFIGTNYLSLHMADGTQEIALSKLLSGVDLNEYQFKCMSENTDIAEALLEGNSIKITPKAKGTATLNLDVLDDSQVVANFKIQLFLGGDELVYSIYPNPVVTKIQLVMNPKVESQTIEVKIESRLGQRVLSNTLSVPASKVCELNVSSLTPGVYVLHITDNKEKFTQKFIKN